MSAVGGLSTPETEKEPSQVEREITVERERIIADDSWQDTYDMPNQ